LNINLKYDNIFYIHNIKMDNIVKNLNNLNMNENKLCIFCNINYTIEYDYENSDLLCEKCNNNYNNFMLEDNNDYTEII